MVCNKRGHSLLENEIMNNDENSPPSETNAEKLETQRLFNLLDLVGEHEIPQVKKAKKGLDPREVKFSPYYYKQTFKAVF